MTYHVFPTEKSTQDLTMRRRKPRSTYLVPIDNTRNLSTKQNNIGASFKISYLLLDPVGFCDIVRIHSDDDL
ncbi:hypothetical protein A6I87_17925 [Prescottella equi]|nr:hypothetical protein A6I87_17925 [Prescottella equi]